MCFSIGARQDVALGMIGKLKLTETRMTAINMMVVIARKSSDKPVALVVVAEIMGVSVSYLEGLAAVLRGAGLVRSFRGPRGGYVLAKPVDTISLLDIALPIKSGPERRCKKEGGSCNFPQVQALWDRLENFQYLLLQKVTLADFLNNDVGVPPLLNRLLDRCEQA